MPINKALSYIEQNLEQPITLSDIAERAGLSSYYFARLFRALTGETAMGYLRQRRLTEVAKILETDQGRPLIHLALDYGFDSQEAFTRAFKRHFGMPPGQYRSKGFSLSAKYQLPLHKPYFLNTGDLPMEPTIVKKSAFNVIGISDDFGRDHNNSVIDLWKKVADRLSEIPVSKDVAAYGLCIKGSVESFTYMASFQVDDLDRIPQGMKGLAVSEAKYAVFTFVVDNKSPIGDQFSNVYKGIWGNWLPNSEFDYAETPDFELYDDRFDGKTATGEVDIWIPIKTKQ